MSKKRIASGPVAHKIGSIVRLPRLHMLGDRCGYYRHWLSFLLGMIPTQINERVSPSNGAPTFPIEFNDEQTI